MSFVFLAKILFILGITIGAFCWHKALNNNNSEHSESEDTKVNFTKRFIGYILITISILMFTLCGGCTLIFIAFETYSKLFKSTQGEGYITFYTIGIIGGIPTALSVLIFLLGRFLKKWGTKW